MKQKPRIYYCEPQKALMWERRNQGDSLQMIAKLFDRNHSSIQRILAESDGIRPAPRCRSRLALTLVEREGVSCAIVTPWVSGGLLMRQNRLLNACAGNYHQPRRVCVRFSIFLMASSEPTPRRLWSQRCRSIFRSSVTPTWPKT